MEQIKCIKCDKELNFTTISLLRNINGKGLRCCKDCGEQTQNELKAKYYVETYKNNDIYRFNERYYPYWECAYSFDTIEGCRARIDMTGVAVVPWCN